MYLSNEENHIKEILCVFSLAKVRAKVEAKVKEKAKAKAKTILKAKAKAKTTSNKARKIFFMSVFASRKVL